MCISKSWFGREHTRGLTRSSQIWQGWGLGIHCCFMKVSQVFSDMAMIQDQMPFMLRVAEPCIVRPRQVSLPVAVSVIVRDLQSCLLANLHSRNSLIPTSDNTTDANLSDKVTSSNRRVELLSLVVWLRGVLQVSGVDHRYGVTLGRSCTMTLLSGSFCDSHCCECGRKVSGKLCFGDVFEWLKSLDERHLWGTAFSEVREGERGWRGSAGITFHLCTTTTSNELLSLHSSKFLCVIAFLLSCTTNLCDDIPM